MEAVEANSVSGDTVSVEEDMKHLGTADTEGASVEMDANSIDHITAESACLEVKNVPSEDNSSTQPTIVGQLLKMDK